MWNRPNKRGEKKLKDLGTMGEFFKEYRANEIRKEIIRIEEKLLEEGNLATSKEDIRKQKALENQKNRLLQSEEVVWRQSSRAIWLNARDINTKFFHGNVAQRKKPIISLVFGREGHTTVR